MIAGPLLFPATRWHDYGRKHPKHRRSRVESAPTRWSPLHNSVIAMKIAPGQRAMPSRAPRDLGGVGLDHANRRRHYSSLMWPSQGHGDSGESRNPGVADPDMKTMPPMRWMGPNGRLFESLMRGQNPCYCYRLGATRQSRFIAWWVRRSLTGMGGCCRKNVLASRAPVA